MQMEWLGDPIQFRVGNRHNSRKRASNWGSTDWQIFFLSLSLRSRFYSPLIMASLQGVHIITRHLDPYIFNDAVIEFFYAL